MGDVFWALAYLLFAADGFRDSYTVAGSFAGMFDTHTAAWWPFVAGTFILFRAEQCARRFYRTKP